MNQYWEQTVKALSPQNFNGMNQDSEEIKADRSFVLLCNQLSEFTNQDPEQMTAFNFYSLLNHVKAKTKKAAPK